MTQSTSTRAPKSARLRGQVALITGATRGIGLALARALAAESSNLILTGRDEKALTKVSRELASAKMKLLVHPCDVRDPHSVDALFRAVRQEFKRLDLKAVPSEPSVQFLMIDRRLGRFALLPFAAHEVGLGDDADELAALVDHRRPGDAVLDKDLGELLARLALQPCNRPASGRFVAMRKV